MSISQPLPQLARKSEVEGAERAMHDLVKVLGGGDVQYINGYNPTAWLKKTAARVNVWVTTRSTC